MTKTATITEHCHTCGTPIVLHPDTNEWFSFDGEAHGAGAEARGSANVLTTHNPDRHWHAPKAQPATTVTLTREQLLDMLTTAAAIGLCDGKSGMGRMLTRGDITKELLTYPTVRDFLPAAVA